MSKFKKITLFDTEKNLLRGKGMTTLNIPIEGLSRRQIERKIKEARADQRQKNKEFKENNKNGIVEVSNKLMIRNLPKVRFLKTIRLMLDRNTGNTTVIFGSSKAGKTMLQMHIFEKFYNKPKFINTLFSSNSQIGLYKGRKNLLKAKNFGKKGEEFVKLEKFINTECNNQYEWVNFFDDIIDIRFNRLLKNLILTFRNSKMSLVTDLQAPKLIPPDMRGNLNNIICMSLNTDELAEQVINIFLKSAFIKLGVLTPIERLLFYKKVTLNRGFIYINPASQQISFHRIPLETLKRKRK